MRQGIEHVYCLGMNRKPPLRPALAPGKPGLGTRLFIAFFVLACSAAAAFMLYPDGRHFRSRPEALENTAPQQAQDIPRGQAFAEVPVVSGAAMASLPPENRALENPAGNTEQPPAPKEDAPHPEPEVQVLTWEPLIARLMQDGFAEASLREMFTKLESPPLREYMAYKALELHGGKGSLAVAARRGASFEPPDYTRIAGGVSAEAGRKILQHNSKLFASLYKQYGVPGNIIVGLLMVETGVGMQLGTQPALLSLGSMASTRTLAQVLPALNGIQADNAKLDEQIGKRSDWAYDELKALILYAKALGTKPETIPGSMYGAIGLCQFMPSNIQRFGASGRGKNVADVFHFADAAASVARYLSAHGWRAAQTPQAHLAVIRTYNHSDIYTSTVYGVAMALISPANPAAQNARGGNIVQAARNSAKGALPLRNAPKGASVATLPGYSDLLE